MKRWIFAVVVMAVVGWFASPAFAQGKSMKAMRATGTVKAVSGDSLTITAGGKDMMFSVDADTKVIAKGASTKSAAQGGKLAIGDAVGNGDRVQVSYHDMSGKMHATEVRVTNKAMMKK
ncbi:MAG TPA: hypothetical protein VIW45_15250 [Vicinamibacterales bacterium]|jgi:hypothetical protein